MANKQQTTVQQWLRAQAPHDAKFGPYADITARNNIPTEERHFGMTVGVLDYDGLGNGEIYYLVGGDLTNASWQGLTELASGSLPDAPADGNQYARKDNAWDIIAATSHDYKIWYVDIVNGNDANDGSFASPVQTINQAFVLRDADGTSYGIIKVMHVEALSTENIPAGNLETSLVFERGTTPDTGKGGYIDINDRDYLYIYDLGKWDWSSPDLFVHQTGTNGVSIYLVNCREVSVREGSIANTTFVSITYDMCVECYPDFSVQTIDVIHGNVQTTNALPSGAILRSYYGNIYFANDATFSSTVNLFGGVIRVANGVTVNFNGAVLDRGVTYAKEGTGTINFNGTRTNTPGEFDISTGGGGFPNYGTIASKNISGGVLAIGEDRHILVNAETGTADDLTEITGTGLVEGDVIALRVTNLDVITIKPTFSPSAFQIQPISDEDTILRDDITYHFFLYNDPSLGLTWMQFNDPSLAKYSAFGVVTNRTIDDAGGRLTVNPNQRRIAVKSNTGTVDDLTELNATGFLDGEVILLTAQSGETITVKHNAIANGFKLINDTDVVLDEIIPLMVMKNSDGYWHQLNNPVGGGGGGAPLETRQTLTVVDGNRTSALALNADTNIMEVTLDATLTGSWAPSGITGWVVGRTYVFEFIKDVEQSVDMTTARAVPNVGYDDDINPFTTLDSITTTQGRAVITAIGLKSTFGQFGRMLITDSNYVE